MFICSTTRTQQNKNGFSFVEVLVTAALVSLVFGGLFAAVQSMINLIGNTKAKAGAIALATEQLEFIRSLEYDAIGTDGGVPSGSIPQLSTTTINNITYQERVLIEYVDDVADGLAGADSNGIVADYKRAKVELSWQNRNGTSSVALVSNIVPPGVETTAGGGTLRVYVNDAGVLPVAGAAVRFVNTNGTSTIDTIRYTDPSGMAQLGGAPALSGYEIYVSRAGYSTDGTAVATGTLSSPAQPVVSVAETSVTTQYFQIDRLSNLAITTANEPTYNQFFDTFTTLAAVASSSNITLAGDDIILAGGPGSYAATGTVIATTTTPATIDSWYSLEFVASTSPSTTAMVQLHHPVGTTTELVPDVDLPGNSVGFTSSPVDISGVDPAVYGSLIPVATLGSADASVTPRLYEWELRYVENQVDLNAIPVTVTGSKTLGTDSGGASVYKNVFSDTTDGAGELALDDIEYDAYSIVVDDPSYDVVEACPTDTVSLQPNTTETVELTLATVAGPRLRTSVYNLSGAPVAGASVRVEQGAAQQTQTTSLCGQTFFSGLSAGTSTVTVTRSGYSTTVVTDVPVHATATASIIIN